MAHYNVKECYYCKAIRKFIIKAGPYGALERCVKCGRTLNITRDAEKAKQMFPDIYDDKPKFEFTPQEF